mmetsp:Transcript_12003/g.30237  ORF Transcript_12003/g.30237 Transcript_12003/m.30237 type:complete len:90 (+) Transcript_12003:1353-1622(+)
MTMHMQHSGANNTAKRRLRCGRALSAPRKGGTPGTRTPTALLHAQDCSALAPRAAQRIAHLVMRSERRTGSDRLTCKFHHLNVSLLEGS